MLCTLVANCRSGVTLAMHHKLSAVVYPPTGWTAMEREVITQPMLLWVSHLYLYLGLLLTGACWARREEWGRWHETSSVRSSVLTAQRHWRRACSSITDQRWCADHRSPGHQSVSHWASDSHRVQGTWQWCYNTEVDSRPSRSCIGNVLIIRGFDNQGSIIRFRLV